MSENDPPIHILMRFSDAFLSVDDTIAEHRSVIRRQGHVWFAKLGKPLGRRRLETVNRQCREGIRTHLYLVQNVGGRNDPQFEAFRGVIVEAARQLPAHESELVPDYYGEQDIIRRGRLWVKLSRITRLREGGLGRLTIASSGRPAAHTLRSSMAALFAVHRGE